MTPQQIRAWRQAHGLTQQALAELLEVGGQPIIARWEIGQHNPPPYLWRALEHLAAELVEHKKKRVFRKTP